MRLRTIVEDLLDEPTIDAVVRDGWPRPMVEAGFALHRQTWDIDTMTAALTAEVAELPDPTPPCSITHVWPALPGAGVTPVLLAEMLGVAVQRIRPSSRGRHFAERFAAISGIELVDDVGDADRYVVSGSDQTIAHLTGQLGQERIVGYGDRQSFAVVAASDAVRHVEALATDITMWFGRGCFSAHAVLFIGDEAEAGPFASALAEAMAEREATLAPIVDDAMFAERAQALGVAQFQTKVWPARIGWIEQQARWDGTPRPANVVTLCVCDAPADALAVPAAHLQGVAWAGAPEHAKSLGVTHVCEPGQLQAPPADWAHDGVSNAAALLGYRSGRL